MDISYIFVPFFAWFCAGCIKFAVNSMKARRCAFDLIGYGGCPSTHSAIVSSMVFLIALKDGLQNPALGVALTLAFIVILDANSLRQQVGKQSKKINHLSLLMKINDKKLRERIGHKPFEIFAGIIVGSFSAWMVWVFIG